MPYNGQTLSSTTLGETERRLLEEGLSYAAIANTTGQRLGTIKERNRLVYRVNIYDAFRKRIERDGIPNRLSVGDDFGYYFAGLFDGEGCMVAWYRRRERDGRKRDEFRLSLQIQLRDDDADVLRYVYENIGGVFSLSKTRRVAIWRLENIKELAEVMVPFFAKYPLRSKKRAEYQIWSRLVIDRYMSTLGGETARGGDEFDLQRFIDGVKIITDARHRTNSDRIVEVSSGLSEQVDHLGS